MLLVLHMKFRKVFQLEISGVGMTTQKNEKELFTHTDFYASTSYL